MTDDPILTPGEAITILDAYIVANPTDPKVVAFLNALDELSKALG